jgi:hypothetical protein
MRKEYVIRSIDASPDGSPYVVVSHEYKQMNLSVGDKVFLELTKAESLGV